MEQTKLGTRGPSVSRYGLGTMSLLTSQDKKAATALVHQAIDRGINLIDTAEVYDNGAVVEALAEALHWRSHDVVLGPMVVLQMNADRRRSGVKVCDRGMPVFSLLVPTSFSVASSYISISPL